MNAEFKVGLLVIIAAIALGWIATQSGVIKGESKNNYREITTTFQDVEGLFLGAKVKMAGITVGDVTDLKLAAGKATVKFTVEKDVPLPANIMAQIDTSGLISEKYLSLVAIGNNNNPLDPSVTEIPSISATGPDSIVNNFANLSSGLDSIVTSLNGAIGGDDNAAKLQQIVDGLAAFSATLENNSETVMNDIQTTMASLSRILGDNEESTGAMLRDFSKTAANLAVITERLEKGEGTIGKLLTTDENGASFDTLLADLSAAAKDLKSITNKINAGEGTIGKFVSDPAMADKIDSALQTFADASERVNAFRTEVDISSYTLTAEEVGKARFDINLQPRPTRFYRVGIMSDGFARQSEEVDSDYFNRDFNDEVKVTAQFGHVFQDMLLGNDVDFRIGMKDSSGGIGFDTDFDLFNRNLTLSTDFYDMNGDNSGTETRTPHWDFTAKYNLLSQGGAQLYTISGYDNILNQEYGSPFFGIGLRFRDDDFKHIVGSAL